MTSPLSPVFLDHLKTLFTLLDEQNTGLISLSSIEMNWARGVAGLPADFIPCLYKVASSDGMLSFNQFVRGVRLSMTARPNVMSKSWTEGCYVKEPVQTRRVPQENGQIYSPPSYSTYMNTRTDVQTSRSHNRPKSALSLPRPQINGPDAPIPMRKSVTLDPAAFNKSHNNGNRSNGSTSAFLKRKPQQRDVSPRKGNHTNGHDYESVVMRKSVTLNPSAFEHSRDNLANDKNNYAVTMRKSVTMDPSAFSLTNGSLVTSQQHGRPDIPPRPASSLLKAKPAPPPRTVSQQPRRPASCHPFLTSHNTVGFDDPIDSENKNTADYSYLRSQTQSFQSSSTMMESSSVDSHSSSRSLQLERRALKDCLCYMEKARARLQCRLDNVNERLTAPVLGPEPPHHHIHVDEMESQIPIMQARVEQACQLLFALATNQQESGHTIPGNNSLSLPSSRAGAMSSQFLLSPSSVEAELSDQVEMLTKELSHCKLNIRQLEREKGCLVRELFDKRRAPSVMSSSIPLSTDI